MSSSAAVSVVGTSAACLRITNLPRGRRCHAHARRALGRHQAAARSAVMTRAGAAAGEAERDGAKELRRMADAVTDELKGVGITFVGDNEEANFMVASAMAKALKYTPLSTPELIERVTGSSRDEIVAEDGEAGLVIAENAVLEQLSTMLRCCTATSGGGKCATARGACWDYLFGQFTVWLDDVPSAQRAAEEEKTREGKENNEWTGSMPQREAYEFADVHLVMSSTTVGTEAEAVGIAGQALGAIKQLIEGDPQLPGKKGFYVKMGCRGDWPVLQPPGWDGTKEGMVDPATGKPYRDAMGPQPAAE